MTAVAERVARGVALLDEHKPGWAKRIDLDALHMSGCLSCVLGQVFADEAADVDQAAGIEYGTGYDAGCEYLGIEGTDDLYGFDLTGIGDTWAGLTAEWRRVIAGRQAPLAPELRPPVLAGTAR